MERSSVIKALRHGIAALALACAPASAHAGDALPVTSFTLKNGMEVIVVENHRVPAISHVLWFKIGAADDPPLKSGLAHYHEHLMFKGTALYKSGQYTEIIAENGGEQNAFTGHDATAYYANIAKDRLPLIMELEADRVRGLTPDDMEALKERDVIIEERRQRIDNLPRPLFLEQMDAALYLNHPYRIPVIGWKHEMEGLTKQDVLDFHARNYHAGNAVLVVSGDVKSDEVKALAEKYYGALPAGPTIVRQWRKEPPQLAPRRITMTHKNMRQPEWRRIYLAPSAGEGQKEKLMPLLVLEHILGGGKTSRLYQQLVTKQRLATALWADYNGLTRGPGEFTLYATPAPGVALSAIEAAVDHEIAAIIAAPPSETEVARAKTLLKADMIYDREGLQNLAYTLGWFRMIGLTVQDYEQWPARADAVTAKDVQQAAKEVFDLNHSVTGMLLPEAQAKP